MGTPVAILEVDGNGNFYTTKRMRGEFGDGDFGSLYPTIVSKEGELHMPVSFSISMGGCNSCHGVDVARIFAK